MKNLLTLVFVFLSCTIFTAQNIWEGTASSDYADLDNWSGDKDLSSYQRCKIGEALNPCVYSSAGNAMIIEMLTGGDLTISAPFNIDKLYASATAVGSNIVIKDGGSVSIRNGNSAVSHGSITVLDSASFDCKSGIYFIWGRWDNDSCFFNLFGGTANFSCFAPWRNGYINDAKIICKGGGVGTFASAANITDWAEAEKLVPAEGSLLTYDAVNSPKTLSSIDLNLPESIDTSATAENYVLPDFFATYATGDTDNAATITVVQTPAAGTSYENNQKIEIIIDATDALENNIKDTVTITIGDIVTDLQKGKQIVANLYPTAYGLKISAEKYSNYSIYALSGKMVCSGVLQNGTANITLDKGVYIAKVNQGSGTYTEKVLIR